MKTKLNQKGTNNLSVGIALGLTIGAGLGVAIGVATKDIAIWLSVGISCGLAIGAGIGIILDNKKKQNLPHTQKQKSQILFPLL